MLRLISALAFAFGLTTAALAQVVPGPTGITAILCAYNTSPPTLVSGKLGYIQCDALGRATFTEAPYAFTPLSPMQAGLSIVGSTALTIPSGATYAVICARGQNVDYTTDGTTTPTASVGMQLLQNQCVSLSGATVLSNFRAIQQAATATLDVSYFK